MVVCHWLLLTVVAATSIAEGVHNVGKGLTIVGGEDVQMENAPYMAFISVTVFHNMIVKSTSCTGTIIDERHVLTAAHCFDGWFIIKTKVVLGTEHPEGDGGLKMAIEKRICHENYDGHINDICLLKLAENITYGPKVEAVDLNGEDLNLPEGIMVKVLGWGKQHTHQEDQTKILKEVSIPMISTVKCMYWYVFNYKTNMPNSLFCAGNEGHGSCFGDSGGPVIYQGEQIGISKSVYGNCEIGFDSFTKISTYMSWIQDNISNN